MKSHTNTALANRIIRSVSPPGASGQSFLTRGCAFILVLMSLLLLSGVRLIGSQEHPNLHRIRVKFNYDFTAMHACPVKKAAPCVKQFDIYDATDTGKRILLFTIRAPEGARSLRTIRGASKLLVFAPGEHTIEVTALANNGKESKHRACTTMVRIKP
ncbi:MAG: hypothetical protein ACRD4R_12430 [Candidatus Acidiferrales bacterium]